MDAEFARTITDGKAGFPELLEAIETYLERHDVPPTASAPLMIAFDEIISNVLNHGGGENTPVVEVRLRIANGGIDAEVTDDGKPFDPLAAPEPDTTLSVEDRQIGGLGIHLVRELMDKVFYQRDSGRNRLRFSKTYRLN